MVRVGLHPALNSSQQVGLQFGYYLVFYLSAPTANQVAAATGRVEHNIVVVNITGKMVLGIPQRKFAQVAIGKKYAVLLYIFGVNTGHHLIKAAEIIVNAYTAAFIGEYVLCFNELAE